MDETGIAERAPDPLPGLLEGRIREAHDREARQSRGHVDLDADHPAVEAVEGRGEQRGEHAGTLSRAAHLRLTAAPAAPVGPPFGARHSAPGAGARVPDERRVPG